MKRFKSLLYILPFFLFTIGFSSFEIRQNQSFRDDELGQTGDNYVTFKYNDGGMTPDYHYYFEGDSTKIAESVIPTANSSDYHRFLGWYQTKSGIDDSGVQNKVDFTTYRFSNGDVLYAKYSSYEIISGNVEPDINQYLYISQTTFSNQMTISSKVDLYTDDGTYNSSKYGTDTSYRHPTEADIYAVLDSDLVIESGGTFQIDAVLGTTGGMSQQISGNFSCLDLNGYTITIKSGGILNAYGLIFNSEKTGGIIVESGATLLTPFCIMDFKGGGYTISSYKNAVMTFANYCCPYLSCETVFYAGSSFKGETSLYAKSSKFTTTIPLLGSDTKNLITLSQGYLIRRTTDYLDLYYKNENKLPVSPLRFDNYLDTDYRETFVFTSDPSQYLKGITPKPSSVSGQCKSSFNQLELTLSMGKNVTVSMKYGDFPIPSFFDVSFFDTDFIFASSVVCMPASKIYFDEKSLVRLSNALLDEYKLFARVSVLNSYPISHYYLVNNNRNSANTYLNSHLVYSARRAKVTMRGKFVFENTGNVSFSDDYSFYSLGGEIDCSDQAIASLKENQAYFKAMNYYFYPYWIGEYVDCVSSYYSEPIISNGIPYFQIGTSRELVQGDAIFHGVIQYNQKKYLKRRNNSVACRFRKGPKW